MPANQSRSDVPTQLGAKSSRLFTYIKISIHNMAAAATVPALLSTLTESLASATSSLPEPTALAIPTEGISLLDTKNELLLSYLQNLAFLILIKVRNQYTAALQSPSSGHGIEELNDEVTKKLVELRVYIEKGVRPLEGRLKYQIDKLILAASEATSTAATLGARKPSRTSNGFTEAAASGSESADEPTHAAAISDLAHRPNPSAFARPSRNDGPAAQGSTGLYRPPRITPTSLPTTERKQAKTTKPRKSTTLDTFIREEMDDAPIAEPSIGAGSGLKGREKEREEERRGYEEQRLVRLPGEKKSKRDKRRGEDLSGGLMGLGDVDFGDLKGGKRKRERDGGGGERVGERWEKRVKKGVGRKRR